MQWRHMSSYVITKASVQTFPTMKTSENHVFQNRDLGLWPWLSYSSEILSKAISMPFHVLMSNGLGGRALTNWRTDTHTHTHTDGTDFIPSTPDAGGKNWRVLKHSQFGIWPWPQNQPWPWPQSKVNDNKYRWQHVSSVFDLQLWPTTLTCNRLLARVKVDPCAKNRGRRSNGSAARARRTNGQTDERYQEHYLPADD